MEPQGSLADRRNLRVPVPRSLFQQAALWVRPSHTPTRLHLLELGRPDLRCGADSELLRLEDISASGLKLTLARPQELGGGSGEALALLRSEACLCYVYLKLSQPLSAQEEHSLSLLLGAVPVAVRDTEDGGLSMAMNFLYRAQPDRDEKSLTFFYVARYAIRELAAWCDEVLRMENAHEHHESRGVRLNRLLLELDTALPEV